MFGLCKSILFSGIILLLSLNEGFSQEHKFHVYFKDKSGETFDPYNYFHPKAIQRRIKNQIPVNHPSDWPVNEKYLQKLSPFIDSLKMCSRWMNMAVVYSDKERIKRINQLPFVKRTIQAEKVVAILTGNYAEPDPTSIQRQWMYAQTERMKASVFKRENLSGRGIRIAILDAGFDDASETPGLQHIFKNNRVVATYDFVRNKTHVERFSGHGTAVMACIGGKIDTINIGMATDASFLLARTERFLSEPMSEEENWLAAAEWADKHGADIINSSLGYSYHRYFPEDMDGRKSLVSKAANMAAKKGILVVNSAGNEATNSWRYIVTPSDADSVLAVGGTNPRKDVHVSFSSFGPSSDFRIKPNVSAFGIVVSSSDDGFTTMQGTSFSSPLVAGFAACALQSDSTMETMKLFDRIEEAGHLFPYFDYAHGYGIPQADHFLYGNLQRTDPTFHMVDDGQFVEVIIQDEYLDTVEIDKENNGTFLKEAFTDSTEERIVVKPLKKNFYYHIERADGRLRYFKVIRPEGKSALKINKFNYNKGDILRVHFEGYTLSHRL